MKMPANTTFATRTVQQARDFRNQATGVSPCLAQSRAQGANRSRRVVDQTPDGKLAMLPTSYPAPGPAFDPLTGAMIDRVTGKAYKGDADCASTWTR